MNNILHKDRKLGDTTLVHEELEEMLDGEEKESEEEHGRNVPEIGYRTNTSDIFSFKKMLLFFEIFLHSETFSIFIEMTLQEKHEIAREIVYILLSTHVSVPTTLNNIGLPWVSFQKQVLYSIYLILLCVILHALERKWFFRWQIYSWQIHACYKSLGNV